MFNSAASPFDPPPSSASPLAKSTTRETIDYDQMCTIVTTDARMLSLLYAPRIFSAPELDGLAASLLKTSMKLHTLNVLLDNLLRLEFEKVASTNTKVILRANTLTTKVMDQYIQKYSFEYLRDTLGDIIKEVVGNENLDFEVDPLKITDAATEDEKHERSDHNADKLKKYATAFTEAIISERSLTKMPTFIKFITQKIRSLAELYEWDPLPLIGNFIMLRLFNPAIVFPERRNIFDTDYKPEGHSRRNLILISKLLQNIANNVRFGNKEEYMKGMNEYIDKYQSRCNNFLMDCCLGEEPLKQFEEQRSQEHKIALAQHRVEKEMREEALNIHFVIFSNEEKITKHITTSNANAATFDFNSFLKSLPEVQDVSRLNPSQADGSQGKESNTEEKRSASEERYRALLEKAKNTDTNDLASQHIITFCGKDKQGLPIAIFNEENIKKDDLERTLLYIVKTLDQFVNSDYSLVWCVNSSSQSRPGLAWMFNVYRTLSRKYKKNLKSFFMVHPVWFYKFVIKFFRPLVSEKFWKKLHLINNIPQMYKKVDPDQLAFSPNVLSHDFMSNKGSKGLSPPVFGTPLKDLMKREDNAGKEIPIMLDKCISYMEKYGLEEQGIFRLSGNHAEIQKIKILFDRGNNNIDFDQISIHAIAGLMKLYLREMPEPLLTFDLYQDFVQIFYKHQGSKEGDDDDVGIAIDENSVSNLIDVEPIANLMTKLPAENYVICKRLFRMAHHLSQHADSNMMHASNLAIVLAPNILQNKNETPLQALNDSTATRYVVRVLISEYVKIFEMSSDVKGERRAQTNRRMRSLAVQKNTSTDAARYETKFYEKMRDIQNAQQRVERQQRETDQRESSVSSGKDSRPPSITSRRSRHIQTVDSAAISHIQEMINKNTTDQS